MGSKALVLLFVILIPSCNLSKKEKTEVQSLPKTPLFEPSWTSPNLFIIENIASMRLRVYDRPCPFDALCDNVLLLDVPVVVGRDEVGKRSRLGSYEISSWQKFYVDGKQEFIPWSKSPVPPKGSPRWAWGKQGAFGWYAMLLTPDADGQWIHGTIGWGEDKDSFIVPENVNGALIRHKSRGCTRVSNEAIAILRNFLPIGTPVFKIYAVEEAGHSVSYQELPKERTWEYVLAKGRDLTSFPLERFDLEQDKIYERGHFNYSSEPVAFPVRDKRKWIRGELNGNPYELKPTDFKGIYWVDKGKLEGYDHPRKLPKNRRPLPDFLIR